MNRGAWRATVYGVADSDMTEKLKPPQEPKHLIFFLHILLGDFFKQPSQKQQNVYGGWPDFFQLDQKSCIY